MPSPRWEAPERGRGIGESEWESRTISSAHFLSEPWDTASQKQVRRRTQRRALQAASWQIRPRISAKSRTSTIERSNSDVYSLFSELSEQWRTDMLFESNIERIVLHPSYQRIIGLGPQVVPYILQDLQDSPDHWFWALTAIVGDDKAVGQTSVGAAAEAWLAWGSDAGLVNR